MDPARRGRRASHHCASGTAQQKFELAASKTRAANALRVDEGECTTELAHKGKALVPAHAWPPPRSAGRRARRGRRSRSGAAPLARRRRRPLNGRNRRARSRAGPRRDLGRRGARCAARPRRPRGRDWRRAPVPDGPLPVVTLQGKPAWKDAQAHSKAESAPRPAPPRQYKPRHRRAVESARRPPTAGRRHTHMDRRATSPDRDEAERHTVDQQLKTSLVAIRRRRDAVLGRVAAVDERATVDGCSRPRCRRRAALAVVRDAPVDAPLQRGSSSATVLSSGSSKSTAPASAGFA